MFLEIVTPAKKVFEGEVTVITFPGVDGQFQVLNDHAPLVSTLKAGELIYKDDKKVNSIQITGGVVEVLHNKVIVLADSLKDN
ncbi:MAG: ATP synthase F1 subunit epsilon [Bacteroidota bacterium]